MQNELPIARPTPAPHAWAEPYLTVGVTGTNGKTSTTSLVAHAFRAAGDSVLTETTLGYALDDELLEVERTIRGYLGALERAAQRGCRRAAIEVTSEALARGFAKRWRFDVGVFTNLSRDHLEAHGSFEHYLASKAQLFVHLGPGRTAVLNACDESALLVDRVIPADVLRLWYAVPSRGALLRPAELVARRVELSAQGTSIELEPSELAERLGGSLETRFVGEIFAENALAAAAGALAAPVDGRSVREGIARCPVVEGRFEVIHRRPIVAVDYAHTPDALARTCETARKLAGSARVFVVFGAGGGRDTGKRADMGRAVGERADVAVVTTDNPRREDPKLIARAVAAGCRRGGRAYVKLEPDRRLAIRHALNEARPDDVVVIAGKGHEKTQIVGEEARPFSDAEAAGDFFADRGR
jgi:UDP-N-acetylmuramoyl-L-alanyl-D-glutamate--2,6-diaminopimelate ligase